MRIPLIARASAIQIFIKTLSYTAAAIIALGAFQFSLFASKRLSNSTAAYALHPDDPEAMAIHYNGVLRSNPTYQPSKNELIHARAALTRAPLSPISLWLIGVSFYASGDMGRADAAMGLANAISRRHPLVQ
jgi:hypothetical protein